MAVTEPAPAVTPDARTPSRPDGCPGAPAPTGAGRTGQGRAEREEQGYEGILRRQSQRESAARTYARSLPIVPVRARGLTIEGADGRRYLDCLSGAGTLALGHNHPVVLEAVKKVLDSGAPLHVLDLATPLKDAFTSELFATLPRELADNARIQFCGPAGTDAVEAALKLVRTATGRRGLLAFTGAYHGMTAGALDASGGAGDVRVTRLPYPYAYRCPFGVGGDRGAELGARWTESLLDDPKSGVALPAGMIVEAVQGEGGVIPAPDDWMRRMRRITADRSVPLVVDEVQTGVGRTGAFWAVEHSGIVPDVMVLSKAIGGSLPLAVVVYRAELDAWEPGAHAGTFRGNQLAMAAGTATLAYVRENKLAERAGTLGARMLSQLQGLASAHPCVGDVRGRGLMIGVELVAPEAAAPGDPAPPAAPALALAVQQECLARGLIVELGGRHSAVVRLLPPLTLTDEQAGAVLDRFADALAAAERAAGPSVSSRATAHRNASGPSL
ncbi:diaminobutyrate--2-oxoglutarate transaminase [Streptomyces sp. NPDC058855]|uniref:diaminobutyrate--2-oxoglutarate transaminase n=1 Tax=Streptomyces sp. NPDC058855 TaxID=3346651 RepID=UPI0036A35CFA